MPFKNSEEKRRWRKRYANRDRKRARRESDIRSMPEVCEVCGQPSHRPALDFDHDHLLGLFRGWLCNACNMTLGSAKDDPARLRALAEYLERFYETGSSLAITPRGPR
jgi:Recombination endonuclease VII